MDKILFPLLALASFLPFVSGGAALILGLLTTLIVGNPYQAKTKKAAPLLLGICIVGLGLGMNLNVIAKVGLQGVGYTITSILLTLIFGMLIAKIFKVHKETAILISAGTAICGGSAIAAVAAAIKAKSENISVALAAVFVLNAIALIIFPILGAHFHLTQEQFGMWSALAIHDTSSVVGAALKYGQEALQVATTVKLTRALWIAPMVVVIQSVWHFKDEGSKFKIKIPWFIYGFIIAVILVSKFEALEPAGMMASSLAKKLFIFTLFLIGANISTATFKEVGWRPFAQAILLWFVVGVGTFTFLSRFL